MKLITIILIVKIFLIYNQNSSPINDCFEYSCEECSSNEYGSCTKCKKGFTLIKGTCPCYNVNCALCRNGFPGLKSCVLCKNNYYTTNYNYNGTYEEGKCTSDISTCITLGNDNTCLECIDEFYPIDKKCSFHINVNMDCLEDNCRYCPYNTYGGCVECKNGYYQSKGKCLENPPFDECRDYNDLVGFYPDFLKEICISSCDGLTCGINDNNCYIKCLRCSNAIYITENCNNTSVCNIEGCLTCFDKEQCYKCERGYYKLYGVCRKCKEACSLCLNSNVCLYCLSGYKLVNGECILENNSFEFDFNVSLYKSRKEKLIKLDEIKKNNITIQNISNTSFISDANNISEYTILTECDKNCEKCYENNGTCAKCRYFYSLENNKCESMECSMEGCGYCERKNGVNKCYLCLKGYKNVNGICEKYFCLNKYCEDCPEDDLDFCEKCMNGTKLIFGYCALTNCSNDENCLYCYDDECFFCKDGTEYDEEKKKCLNFSEEKNEIIKSYNTESDIIENEVTTFHTEKSEEVEIKTSESSNSLSFFIIIIIIIIIVAIVIFLSLVIFCIVKCKKKKKSDNNINKNINCNIGINQYKNRNYRKISDINSNDAFIHNTFSKINSDAFINFEKEFEIQKEKADKEYNFCDYCKFNPGKCLGDCGCILCEEHSHPFLKIENGDTLNICQNCDKPSHKFEPIKSCMLCFKKNYDLSHFKCGCIFLVCKDCYIKNKRLNVCPGCGKKI